MNMKKGDTFECRLFNFSIGFLLATIAGCSAASTGGIAGIELNAGINFKSISQKIDFHGLRLIVKFLFHDKLETVYIEYLIVVFGLIQSHGQRGAASAAGI